MLVLFLSGKFLLHISRWLHFSVGSFCYTSHAGFIFIWGVSLTHPMLAFIYILFFNLWNLSYTSRCWLHFYAGISLTHPVLALFFIWGVSLTHPVLASFFCGEFLTRPVLACFFVVVFSGEFLLHIPCWLHFYAGSLSYTSRACFIFMQGVCLTHPVLASFLCREFILHIPCWLHFYAGSFSYTFHAVLRKWLKIILGEFLSHIPCWLLLCREFFHILCWLYNVGSFSYMPHAGCIMWGVSFTHPVLASWSGVSLTCFPGGWWLLYVEIFSYISHGCAYHTNCL